MTPFEQQNHYEVLDIFPEATPYEVREAYKTALKLYDDPMATYSLFSEDEKTQILCRIEEAFLTLISQESRPRYDRMLVRLGRTEEDSLHKGSSKEPIPLFDLKSSRAATSSASIIRPKPTSARPARQSVVDVRYSHARCFPETT